jgi:two-component system sensor histidine kinase KdpD
MSEDFRRRNPDELLAEIELEEHKSQRGQLKVFLGYASGVGKSLRMLDEGRRRRERGEDVVACALQPGYSPEIQAIVQHLEVIPTLQIDAIDVIDLPAVIRRRPAVALIDGLAFDNPPGSRHPHRWQDMEELLDAGISVLTTLNIQYLENLQQDIERITGKRASLIIPRSVLDKSANEIAIVDAPSEESVLKKNDGAARLAEKHKLSRLRELALLIAASVVDRQLEGYLRSQGTELTWGVQERIVVYVSPAADAAHMLESGRRNADRFQGEFHVLYLDEGKPSRHESGILAANLQFAKHLGADLHPLKGSDIAALILEFALQHGITQIFVGRGAEDASVWKRLQGDLPVRLIRAAEGIDVVVYPRH